MHPSPTLRTNSAAEQRDFHPAVRRLSSDSLVRGDRILGTVAGNAESVAWEVPGSVLLQPFLHGAGTRVRKSLIHLFTAGIVGVTVHLNEQTSNGQRILQALHGAYTFGSESCLAGIEVDRVRALGNDRSGFVGGVLRRLAFRASASHAGLRAGDERLVFNVLHIGDRRVLEQRRILLRRDVAEDRVRGAEVVVGTGLQAEENEVVGQVVDRRSAQLHFQSLGIAFGHTFVVFVPVRFILVAVDLGANGGSLMQHLVTAFESGSQQALNLRTVSFEEGLRAYNHIGHLRAILLRADYFDQSAFTLGDSHVARRPGHNRIDANMLGLAGKVAVLHDLAIVALSGNVVRGSYIVVGSVDPVDRVRIVGFLVWIVLDAVVAFPLLGDIPIAVAQHTLYQQAFRRLRIALNFGRRHERVLTTAVARRAYDLGLEVGSELLQLWIDSRQKLTRTVTHDQDEIRAVGTLRRTVGDFSGARNQVLLHLAGIVLADQRQVNAVLFHQRALRRGRSAVGINQSDLGVPFPNLAANQSGAHARGSRCRKGNGLDVLHHRILHVRQYRLLGHQRFHHPGSGNPAKLGGFAQPEDKEHYQQDDQDYFRASL